MLRACAFLLALTVAAGAAAQPNTAQPSPAKKTVKAPALKKNVRPAWAEYQALPPHERESLVPAPRSEPRRRKN